MAVPLPVLIVGDVHGDLERLFAALRPYPAEQWRTFFLGDLVDGGPFGVGALRYARDRPNTTVLLGNHEALLLGALRDRTARGPALRSWLGAGGQPHELEELARDPGLQCWLRERPAMVLLEDGTLLQHCDSDALGLLVPGAATEVVAAVNREVSRLLQVGEVERLVELMTPRGVFRRQPFRLESWLRRTGARRVVHGHTPHHAPEPEAYAGGRAICYDGGLGRWGGRGRRGGPARASVAPLPAAKL
ncbi:MAG TPA: metallophosphoesterase [Candidatus Dormibacteraeota bacterium]|nr:metallophosphoesterase [Candidatus Dormibacteraeota bacterium]